MKDLFLWSLFRSVIVIMYGVPFCIFLHNLVDQKGKRNRPTRWSPKEKKLLVKIYHVHARIKVGEGVRGGGGLYCFQISVRLVLKSFKISSKPSVFGSHILVQSINKLKTYIFFQIHVASVTNSKTVKAIVRNCLHFTQRWNGTEA